MNIIYYFSGTGNSLRTAMRIGEFIGGAELISIKNDPKEVSSKDADIIGFVCPVYEWDMPGRMQEFVMKLTINPKAYIFMISTYILVHGKSFETMEKILNQKGAHLSYGRALRCVASQCTAYPPFPSEKFMIPRMEKNMQKIGKEIHERKLRKYPHMSPVTRKMYPKKMGPYLSVEKYYDKGFYTSDACVGCGVCKNVCPLQNITLEDKHPVWHHDCHGCMACVSYCPTKAIQFKTPEEYLQLNTIISNRLGLPEKRKRYHNPYIKAADLMRPRVVQEKR